MRRLSLQPLAVTDGVCGYLLRFRCAASRVVRPTDACGRVAADATAGRPAGRSLVLGHPGRPGGVWRGACHRPHASLKQSLTGSRRTLVPMRRWH